MKDLDPRIYSRRRRPGARLWRFGNLPAVRALTRILACLFLFSSIGYGLSAGGHLDSPGGKAQTLTGRLAPVFGRSAQTIRIAGLKRQPAERVLAALGIEPGSPLFGFDESRARRLLENIDWIEEAHVRTVFPNTLEIDLIEREPFAIWQRDGRHYVIDRTGIAISLDAAAYAGKLPLVSGAGAQTAAYELFNQLRPHSALLGKLKAAARVGRRRWNLYLDGNVKIALPEQGIETALAWIERMDAEYGLLSMGIMSVDLRLPHRVAILPQEQPEENRNGQTLKVSNRQ